MGTICNRNLNSNHRQGDDKICLIVWKPKTTLFHDTWLRDFYKRNDDGFGIMFAEDGKLYVHKSLGDADRFIEVFRLYQDKELLIHTRMRTHGKVDLDNCHPYEVLTREEGGAFGPVWMMHNGVLSIGNDSDRDKSDTWHYIKNFLRPILLEAPALLLNPSFQHLMGSHIGGGNKFTFMTSTGEVVIINRGSGVMWNDAWMSNTYAWSASSAKIPGVGSGNYNYSSSTVWRAGDVWDNTLNKWVPRSTNHDYRNRGSDSQVDLSFDADGGRLDEYDIPVLGNSTLFRLTPVETAAQQARASTGDYCSEYGEAAAVFQILNEFNLKEAYAKLTVEDVQLAINKAPDAMIELIGEIKKGAFNPKVDDDDFIIKYVKDLAMGIQPEAERERRQA